MCSLDRIESKLNVLYARIYIDIYRCTVYTGISIDRPTRRADRDRRTDHDRDQRIIRYIDGWLVGLVGRLDERLVSA